MGNFRFEEGKPYIMPVYFGSNNFWYDEDGQCYQPATVESVGVTFETNPQQIDDLLPERFTSNAPIITVQANEMNYIGWCGGGSYKMLKITTPVHFKGDEDEIDGELLLALFEDDPSQSLCGREMAGYCKPGCRLPRYTNFNGIYTSYAFDFETSFPFMKMRIDTNKKAEDTKRLQQIQTMSQGIMSYAYYPRIDKLDEARDQFVTLMPKEWKKPEGYKYELMERQDTWCSGYVEFYEPESKMDMPQWLPIGKGLARLEIREYLAACHSLWNEPCDYGRTRILK